MNISQKIALVLFLGFCSHLSLASVATADEAKAEKSASVRVAEYRALRKACAITRGERRQECFAQLNAATPDYKRAKKELAMQQPADEQGPILGQAQ